jgi:competence protein ComEA
VLTGWWVWSARPHSVPLGDHSPVAAPSDSVPALSRSPGPAPVVTSTSASPPAVVVDVEGKVRRPGLYRLPAGARVADAIRAAGGVRTGVETTRLNLAARVTDGQQIAVGVAGATAGDVPAGASGGSGDGASTGPTAPVDLNTATLDQLETLPGVGPVLGQHILDWRAAHGSFASIAQLDDVPGIGPAKFGELKGLVTV